FFAFRATSLADHIGKRITRRGARDTEEPAVGLIQIRDYADCDRDRKRGQGDDNSGYGIESRNEPEACKKDHQPDRQYAVERCRYRIGGFFDDVPAASEKRREFGCTIRKDALLNGVFGGKFAQFRPDRIEKRSQRYAFAQDRI